MSLFSVLENEAIEIGGSGPRKAVQEKDIRQVGQNKQWPDTANVQTQQRQRHTVCINTLATAASTKSTLNPKQKEERLMIMPSARSYKQASELLSPWRRSYKRNKCLSVSSACQKMDVRDFARRCSS